MDSEIPNYLMCLALEKKNFYLETEDSTIRSLITKGVEKYGRTELSSKLEVTERTLYYYEKCQRKPSVKMLLELISLLQSPSAHHQLFATLKSVSTQGHRGHRLPKKYTPDLAYFVGVVAGDGSLPEGTTISITNSSEEYLEKVISPIVQRLFGVIPAVFQERNHYRLGIYSRQAYFFLTNIIGLPVGKKKGFLKIPQFVFLHRLYRLSFLQGMFDTDGGLTLSKKGARSILYSSSTLPFLEEMQLMLQEFEIYLPGPYKSGNKKGFEIRSFKKSEMRKFYIIIGSKHPERADRLSALVA